MQLLINGTGQVTCLYAESPDPSPAVFPRHRHGDALVLVVGTGADDGPPAESDVDEI